jgi:hypothetical protein
MAPGNAEPDTFTLSVWAASAGQLVGSSSADCVLPARSWASLRLSCSVINRCIAQAWWLGALALSVRVGTCSAAWLGHSSLSSARAARELYKPRRSARCLVLGMQGSCAWSAVSGRKSRACDRCAPPDDPVIEAACSGV